MDNPIIISSSNEDSVISVTETNTHVNPFINDSITTDINDTSLNNIVVELLNYIKTNDVLSHYYLKTQFKKIVLNFNEEDTNLFIIKAKDYYDSYLDYININLVA